MRQASIFRRTARRLRVRSSVAILVLAWWCSSAQAGVVVDENEYLLLPEYCRAQGNVAPKYYNKYLRDGLVRKWQSALGSNYGHYHHFCWAIVLTMRAYRSSSPYGSTRQMASYAVGEVSYSLEHATPDFILLPEVYTKQGEAFLLARDDRNAEAAFRKAWEIKPDYWRPYVWWGQHLLNTGKFGEALAVAEEGLKNAPEVKALQDLARDARVSRGKQKK